MRSNGNVQDLRAPLEDGQQIQILTTRDKDDPDALYVLRHSTAHLLAEAVRRLYPGTKIAIGPPIENGFYYDFEFPEPIGEEALERIEEEIRKELAEGRSWNREEVSAEEAKRYFAEQGEDYKVELVDTAEGPITTVHAGRVHRPLPRAAPAGLQADQGGQADRPRRRVLARGRAQQAADADLRHGLLRPGGPRRVPRAARAGAAPRPPPARRRSSTSSTSPTTRPGCRSGTRRGWSIWNALEDLRRRENARRGYVEVKTPLMYDVETWKTSGHWRSSRTNMFLRPGLRRGRGRSASSR